MTLSVEGGRIVLESNDAATFARLQQDLPPNASQGAAGPGDARFTIMTHETDVGRRLRLHIDGRFVDEFCSVETLATVVGSLLHFNVALHAKDGLFVHAGVVAVGPKAIVLPGRSMSGKSSLVAALVRAGAEYYSDEYAVIDKGGLVRPFARRITLRENGRTVAYRAADLGGSVGRSPRPIGMVVWTKYRPGARWRPRQLTLADTLLALFDNTVLARVRPEVVLPRLRLALEQEPLGLRGSHGGADQLAGWLMERASRGREHETTPDKAPRHQNLRRRQSRGIARVSAAPRQVSAANS